MELSADQDVEALDTEPLVAIPSWPAGVEPARVERPRFGRLRVVAISFAITMCVIALAATALVQATQRRRAEDTVASTRRDLATTQEELAAAGRDLTAARIAADAAEARSTEQQARADEAEGELDAATSVTQQSLASQLAATGELDADTASCVAKSAIDDVGLAVALQAATAETEAQVPDEFVRALLHATADCLTLRSPTT